MKIKILFITIWTIVGPLVFAQENIPVIKATSKYVKVKVGKELNKNRWIISPETNPDIYETSALGKKVTFITDKEKISVKIKYEL